jgi:hypothetical protein
MDKEAMKTLDVPNWMFANKAYKVQQEKGVNGDHINGNGDVKKNKEERSDDLAVGLARLAYRCHVRAIPVPAYYADTQEYKLSGRVLRRMPMMAHTRYIGRQRKNASSSTHRPERWLDAMEKFVEAEQQDRRKVGWDMEATGI